MIQIQTITREGTFDAGHRVMYERFKCNNIHGHTYKFEVSFYYHEHQKLPLGYAIDFKEVKRTFFAFIDQFFDHGTILNPADTVLRKTCLDLKSKYWELHCDKTGFRNPTVENIAQEIFWVLAEINIANFKDSFTLCKLVLWETPNCKAEIALGEHPHIGHLEDFVSVYRKYYVSPSNSETVKNFTDHIGVIDYDSRNLPQKLSDEDSIPS